jgi:hypothetical protein
MMDIGRQSDNFYSAIREALGGLTNIRMVNANKADTMNIGSNVTKLLSQEIGIDCVCSRDRYINRAASFGQYFKMLMKATYKLIVALWQDEVKFHDVLRSGVGQRVFAIADVTEPTRRSEDNLACARANTFTIIENAINGRR